MIHLVRIPSTQIQMSCRKHVVGLQDLPLEVIANITNHVNTIQGLSALVRASAVVWRYIGTVASSVELVDKVLTNDDRLEDKVKVIIRTIAYIRSGCLLVNSLTDFRKRIGGCIKVDMAQYLHMIPSEDLFQPSEFPAFSSPILIRGLLMTISTLFPGTNDCLEYYLAKFRALRPRRPKDERFSIPKLSWYALSEENPESYVVNPPSKEWLTLADEDAVQLGFWRCQLVFDLKRAIDRGILTNWPPRDVRELRDATVPMVYDMDTARRALSMLDIYGNSFFTQGFQISEHCMILTVLDYMHDKPLRRLTERLCMPSSSLEDRSDEDQAGELQPGGFGSEEYSSEQDDSDSGIDDPSGYGQLTLREQWSDGVYHFYNVFGGLHSAVDFALFRRFGFGIWSEKRLREHGFVLQQRDDRSVGPDLYAWTSVLPPEEHEDRIAWDRLHAANPTETRIDR